MAQGPWDAIIVGQGLAGTTLAWHLVEAGQKVLLIDAAESVTSSKIAAGLITPITGKRLVLTQRFDDCLPVARQFYTRIEQRTGRTFFHDRKAVRLLTSDDERERWALRLEQPAFQAHLTDPQPNPLLDPELGDDSGGGFEMGSAQLDVAAYLAASREAMPFATTTLDWRQDVTLGSDGISVKDHRAHRIVSCEGHAATRNPYFSWVPFRAAKGDVLTVRFHWPVPAKVLHRGIWVAPTADPQVFRVGSTYDWDALDNVPSASARDEIERNLKAFIDVPYTVLDHQAAVRPIVHESKPLIGLHPGHQRLGYFNGLGSKGALLAPWFAQVFTDLLVHETPVPADCDVRKYFR